MYHLFYLLIALAVAGLVRTVLLHRARPGSLVLLAAFFLTFWAGQLYHTITLFMVWGIATTLGSYLYAIVTAEVALSVAGLRAIAPRAARPLVVPFGVAVFALLDLYTVHLVLLPYYTGLTAHRPNGGLAAFHPGTASLSEFLTHLHAFKSNMLTEPVLAALWTAYFAATIALVVIATASRSCLTAPVPEEPR
jgi:hypothetical protein